jgi:2-dehydropantoate 2-reductase
MEAAAAHYTPPMRFTMVGSGAVGGYYGAKLARAGHDVTFIARGTHLDAIRRDGLSVKSSLGDFIVRARAESDPAEAPAADVVILAVKAYSNDTALGLVERGVRGNAVALTLQNGVDSVNELAAVVDRRQVLGGSTYIAAAVASPGVIEQTGTHRRIVFGEVFGDTQSVSARVRAIHDAFASADIESEPVADAHVPIWEKFCYLVPFAAFTGAARLPIGPLWADPAIRQRFVDAVDEVESVARAEGIDVPPGMAARVAGYIDNIPGPTRSSLLIDLQQGKPIEVEALLGAVCRRAAGHNVHVPIVSALYAVLKPHAAGAPSVARLSA